MFNIIWTTIDAINVKIPVEFPLTDVAQLAQLEAEFAARSRRGVWRGQVGAVDGVHFSMLNPGNSVPNPLRYFVGRKDEYALLCIAVCDADRRILFFDISQAPTTHDSMAWAASSLGQAVQAGLLPHPYFINGDAAFALSNSMIVPSGEAAYDAFDFEQSSNRMAIECAFGIIFRRWGDLVAPPLYAV